MQKPQLLINIDVPDLAAAIVFYKTGLGFTLRRMLFEATVAEMESAAGRVFLIQHDAGSIAVTGTLIARDYSTHWTPVHLDIAVEDLDAAVARARAAGADLSVPISRHRFGDIARMRDPFGHGFCLIKFSDIGYDSEVST
jgi:predicted enzyme related to lactoylglutathione lyase